MPKRKNKEGTFSRRVGRPKKYRRELNLRKNVTTDVVSPDQDATTSKISPSLPHPPPPEIHTNIIERTKNTKDIDDSPLRDNQKSIKMCKEVSPSSQASNERRRWTKAGSVSTKKSGNRLIDLDSLVSMIEMNTVCKSCGSELNVTEETVGISTSIKLKCTNSNECGVKIKTLNERTHFSGNKTNYKSIESFATNVYLVLGLQQIGAGASDCGVLLSFLNLPSAASFQSKSFIRIESCLRPTIKKLTQQSIERALKEEIVKTIEEEEKEPTVRKSLLEQFKSNALDKEKVPLTICYDMGWNKRSSGTRYDSVSGHGIMIGGYTKKVIGFKSMSKECSVCSNFEKQKKKDEELVNPPEHECTKNHDGSSKSMECEAILQLVTEAFIERNFMVGTIVADDDTTMKKTLRHNYKENVRLGLLKKEDWPKNKKGKYIASGRLPNSVTPPHFLADFNHRVKSVGRAVYELALMSKSQSMVDKNLAKRMKQYWSKMLQQIKKLHCEKDWNEIQERVRAPLEHVFNNHEFCQESWCYALQARKENKVYVPDPKRPFYSKEDDSKMYLQLGESLQKFQKKENVRECFHSFDTQKNEAVNNVIARVAPKFKHFGTTPALDTRICTVVGSTNMGYKKFYNDLIKLLVNSEAITDTVIAKGIKRIDLIKNNNCKRKKTKKNKRDRTHGKESKSKKEVYEARIDDEKNMGTYKGSIAVNDSDDEEKMNEEQEERENIQQSSDSIKKRQKTINKTKFCAWCNADTNHKTWRSVHCTAHNDYLKQKKGTNEITSTYNDGTKKKGGNVSGGVNFDDDGGGVAIDGVEVEVQRSGRSIIDSHDDSPNYETEKKNSSD